MTASASALPLAFSWRTPTASFLFLATFVLAARPTSGATCESLAKLTLPDTTITLAKAEPAGTSRLSSPTGMPGPPFENLPAFCRVLGDIKPTKDSDIKFELWMPTSGWNGKFMGLGNGGWAGGIWNSEIGDALRRGYAAANTDTGHEGGGADFALSHPEKVIDFAYRAVHEMTVKAKSILAVYYGVTPKHSYWNGCSTGGKQGLTEAQRFPKDYDGIIAGAPANYWTHLMVSGIWIGLATSENPTGYLPKEKSPLLHKAVLEACDALDGVKDGVLENPKRCHFDPKVLQCRDTDGPNCLTTAQLEATRKIYSGPKNPRTGEHVFPGLEPGSENGWDFFAAGAGSEPPIVASHFKYLVFHDPKWDYRTLNFDTDVALADKLDNGVLNATNANLKEFFEHGGKLLLYHGWNDPAIAPQNTVNYYDSVVVAMGGADKVQSSIRLFMAPGMDHCSGGDGPFDFDDVAALEQWVEKGRVPDRIIAAHFPPGPHSGKPDRTRPLCPYPQVAKYTGSGSTDDASNFVCSKE